MSSSSSSSSSIPSLTDSKYSQSNVAVHLLTELHGSLLTDEMLKTLEMAECRPMLDAVHVKMMIEQSTTKDQSTTKEESEQKTTSVSSTVVSSKITSSFASASPVVIFNMSMSPPVEVESVNAFGLNWAPMHEELLQDGSHKRTKFMHALTSGQVQIRESNNNSNNNNSSLDTLDTLGTLDTPSMSLTALPTVSTMPTSHHVEENKNNASRSRFKSLSPNLLPMPASEGSVVFCSAQSALFSAPPSSALGKYHQQLKQLPLALESNAQAMLLAEEKGEITEIGALYLERKRLVDEQKRMQAEVPPNADVIEVRDTLTLPFGFIPLDGNMYFLQPRSQKEQLSKKRKLALTAMYPCGKVNDDESTFADSNFEHNLRVLPGSKIITSQHIAGLIQVCEGRPQIKALLYRASRDGFKGSDFHRMCDDKGPTLMIMRTTQNNKAPQSAIVIG